MKTTLVLILAAGLALAGCAANNTTTTTTSTPTTTPTESTSGGPQTLAFVATQTGAGPNTTYHFDGPATATAGWAHVTLTNNGAEGHQIVFLKLPAGETYMQHMAMMMGNNSSTDMGSAHANATFVGGVASSSPLPPPGAPQPPAGAPAPNVESSWVFLTPGTYVLECDIPGAAGPHALHGMTKELTVTGTAPTDKATGAPTSDLGLTLVDFNFTWSGTPTAGHHVIKVENKGSMPHEAVLLHLAANKTTQDFVAWEQSGAQGAPPVMDTFGAGALSPGEIEYVDATFQPGSDYGQICFLPDMAGMPHLLHGMIGQFHVA